MSTRVPSLFVSHSLPPLALLDDPYNSSLINFGAGLEIKGIVCVSSQWISPGPIQITSNPEPFIQHNFQGYQKELYDLTYKTPASSGLLDAVAGLLEENDFEISMNPNYGFDYGVWMPLRLIRPEGDLPVVQISLPLFEDPRKVMKLGHALSSLREDGILLVGSGSAALNANKIIWYARGEDVHPKVQEFDKWLTENFMAANIENILDYKSAPGAEFSHPTSASLLPLFFTMGSSISGDRPQLIYQGFRYSSTSLLTICLADEALKNKSFS